ncbi:hypothetical protein ACFSUK_00200 [Sphingobium scionense]
MKERGQEPVPELTREQYQIERQAKAKAERTGEPYEPVTEGKQRQAVEERRGRPPDRAAGRRKPANASQKAGSSGRPSRNAAA